MTYTKHWTQDEVARTLGVLRMARKRSSTAGHHNPLFVQFLTDPRVAHLLAAFLAGPGFEQLRVVGDAEKARATLFDLGWALNETCDDDDSRACKVCWAIDVLCMAPMLTRFVDVSGSDICRALEITT